LDDNRGNPKITSAKPSFLIDNNCDGQSDEGGVCDVDCQVSGWSGFSACSASCGDGVQSRSRSVVVSPLGGGAACLATTQSRSCNTHQCLVDADGYPSTVDCDDNHPNVYPGRLEYYDGRDNDCNDLVDDFPCCLFPHLDKC